MRTRWLNEQYRCYDEQSAAGTTSEGRFMNTAGHHLTEPKRPALALVPRLQQASDSVDSAGRCLADDEAIKELWDSQGPALMRFALKLTLGDRQRAEDIVQEALMRAWRHPEVVNAGVEAIRPWLFTVTRRIAIDMWRARSRHEDVIDDEPLDRPDPVEPIEQAMTALDVRAALAKLTQEHRYVIVEMYYSGRSVAEIALSLGIPEGTVKSRSYYAIRQLRQLLEPAAGGVGQATTRRLLHAKSA